MKRNRLLVLLAALFLLQYTAPSSIFSDPNFPLTQIKVGSDPSDHFFKQIYESVCIGLSIYKLDAIEHNTKEKIMTGFHSGGGNSVRFDMGNMDIGKKGWTRYYPFSIGDKNFMMRIFLTKELQYQPKVKVLYEGTLDNPAVTFQVLPSLGELLSDCSMKPFRAYSTSQVDKSA